MTKDIKQETTSTLDFQVWNLFLKFENSLKSIKYLPFLAVFRNIFEDFYSLTFNNEARNNKYLRFVNLNSAFKHLFWFFLWSIKYILFKYSLQNKKIVLVSVGSDRILTFNYLDAVLTWSSRSDLRVLSLNIICKYKYLFNKSVLYYPKSFLFFHKRLRDDIFRTCYSKIKDINKVSLFEDFKPSLSTIKTVRYLCAEMLGFIHLLKNRRTQIFLLLQDFDYTDNKYIFCNIAKRYGIPTLSLDHSILPFKYMYSNSYSDVSFVWGQYQKNRILTNSPSKPSQILVIGKPDTNFAIIQTNKNKKYWTYIPNAYSHPGVVSFNRNIELLYKNITRLRNILADFHDKFELILKIHPQDIKSTYSRFRDTALVRIKSQPFLSESEVIFTEDSSFTIELLRYDTPIIYISDAEQNDPFKIKEFESMNFYDHSLPLNDFLNNKLITKIDWIKRQTHFEYFFEPNANYNETISSNLEKRFGDKI